MYVASTRPSLARMIALDYPLTAAGIAP